MNKLERTEMETVKIEKVENNTKERTTVEIKFLVPMRLFYEIETKFDESTKETIRPLLIQSIKEGFNEAEEKLKKYLEGFNEFKI